MKAAPVPLHERPYLTFPEAMRFLRLSRATIADRIAKGRYKSIMDGKREKIITRSILQDLENELAKANAA